MNNVKVKIKEVKAELKEAKVAVVEAKKSVAIEQKEVLTEGADGKLYRSAVANFITSVKAQRKVQTKLDKLTAKTAA